MPVNCRNVRYLIGTVTLYCLAALPAAAAEMTGELSRYKLEVGQVITYRYVNPLRDETTKQGRFATWLICEWTYYVTRQQADGRWRVLFRDRRTTRAERPGREPAVQTTSWDGFFELAPDGRMVEDGIRSPADPSAPFPSLPTEEAELTGGWQSKLALTGATRQMRASRNEPANVDEFRFQEDHQQLTHAAQLSSERRDYVFDRQLGLVRAMTITFNSSRKGKSKISRMELIGSRQLEAAELEALQVESDRYIESVSRFQQATDRASANMKTAAVELGQAAAELERLEPQLTVTVLREMLDDKRKLFDLERAFHLENTKRFQDLIDRPAPSWSTTDLDGKPRGLADFRGKVLVLDFWYRGCGPCVQLMPQLNEVAEDFAGQDVAIVGMNSDADPRDARFVVELLKLKYQTLRDGTLKDGIHDKYRVAGWPTVFVIDRQGIVRHVHCGYAPNLRAELAGKIRACLSEKDLEPSCD